MALTDAQVLTQLKARRIRLKLELERVEIAIKAFEQIDIIDPLEVMPYMVDDIVVDDDLLMSTLLYNPTMSDEKKVLYVLSKIIEGDANAIATYLLRIDPHIKSAERTYERITYVASRLYRLGKLDAIRMGKKNIYKLKIVT
jgi:hypothetical protein